MKVQVLIRRDSVENFTTSTFVPQAFELVSAYSVNSDQIIYKIGDGKTSWEKLPEVERIEEIDGFKVYLQGEEVIEMFLNPSSINEFLKEKNQRMFEKEIEQKLKEKQKEKERREKRKKHKSPSYKGYHFRNWLVYPLGVISVELDLAHQRKYDALIWSEEKAIEIINKYLVKICDFDEETNELSFSTDWHRPWECYSNKKDKLWCSKFNYELTRFLEEKYECEGFKKSIGEGYASDWITFTKI